MKFSLPALLVLTAASVCAQNFTPDISNGRMPSTMTAEDKDKMEVPKNCYKNGTTNSGWTVSSVGQDGYCFISPSHSHDMGEQNNWLTTQTLRIEKGAVIRWKDRSVYPDFPDTYHVIVKDIATGTQKMIYEGTADAFFTPHLLSLSEYAGKDVKISFVCTSEDGYILAIKDMFIGVPSTPLLSIDNRTRVYSGRGSNGLGDTVDVWGTILNHGSSATVGRIDLVVDGKIVKSHVETKQIATGEGMEFYLHMPVTFNKKTDYTISVKGVNGTELISAEGTAMASWFPRTNLIDEGTGTWCNNCPGATIEIRNLEQVFKDQMAVICTHIGTGDQDPWINDEYMAGLSFYAIPHFLLNRIPETKASKTTNFDKGLWNPTLVSLKLTNTTDGLEVELTCGTQLDNSNDRYRLGYVLTADFYQTEADALYIQRNVLSTVSSEEYYFLPSNIVTHLAKFHRVNIGGEGYFEGVSSSIPDELLVDTPQECMTIYPDIPGEDYPEWTNPRAIVYVLDTENGHIMNAASILLDGTQTETGLGNISSEESPVKVRLDGRKLKLSGSDSARVTILSVDGRILHSGNVNGSATVPEYVSGPVIIQAVAKNGTAVSKTIIK